MEALVQQPCLSTPRELSAKRVNALSASSPRLRLPLLPPRAGLVSSFCKGSLPLRWCQPLGRSGANDRRPSRKAGRPLRAEITPLDIAPVTAAVYGASLLGGGLFAFTRTGSKGSLGGGVVGSVALGVAFFLTQVPETEDLGLALGFGTSLLFAAVFGIRLSATKKMIPSGVLLAVSTIASIIFAFTYFQVRLSGPSL